MQTKRLDPRDRDCQRVFAVVSRGCFLLFFFFFFWQTWWCCWYGGTADSTVPDRPRGPYGVFTQDGAKDTYGVMHRDRNRRQPADKNSSLASFLDASLSSLTVARISCFY